jgi:hypothetical protein
MLWCIIVIEMSSLSFHPLPSMFAMKLPSWFQYAYLYWRNKKKVEIVFHDPQVYKEVWYYYDCLVIDGVDSFAACISY